MTLLERVNEKYAELVLGRDFAYRAPESRPQIQSRSLLALIAVLEEIEGERITAFSNLMSDAMVADDLVGSDK